MSEILIRTASAADVPAIHALLADAERWLVSRGMPMWLAEDLSIEPIREHVAAGMYQVAADDGEVVGALRFQLEDPEFWPDREAGDDAFVHRLVVRRDHAGRGVSTALLAWARARTREIGRRFLRLDCDAERQSLREFYERFGFRFHSHRQVGPHFVARYELDVDRAAGDGSPGPRPASARGDRLVVAVASSALFDLDAADRIFRDEGEEAYRGYQREHENDVLSTGVAFPLIRRLLALNGATAAEQIVDVVLLSRNDPDTGLRVFNSIEHYGLPISRAAFVKGRNPFAYMDGFNASLFLSANEDDVRRAIDRGLPAGRVFPTDFIDDEAEPELRIAFDFDGIIADDSAEAVFQQRGLQDYHQSEREKAAEPLRAGPLQRFFPELASLQVKDRARANEDPEYQPRLRIAIVTARSAPAHKRVITTLRDWGIQVDEAFFLGGVGKAEILREFHPHIFFDDQIAHIEGASRVAPSVHVPFGVTNR